jgi:hypothetical protein
MIPLPTRGLFTSMAISQAAAFYMTRALSPNRHRAIWTGGVVPKGDHPVRLNPIRLSQPGAEDIWLYGTLADIFGTCTPSRT